MSDRRKIHRVRIVNARLKPSHMPKVSAHALLRYAERVCGFDLVKARLLLSSEAVQKAILHGGSAVLVEGIKIVIEGNSVVTVLDPKMRAKEEGRQKKKWLKLGDMSKDEVLA